MIPESPPEPTLGRTPPLPYGPTRTVPLRPQQGALWVYAIAYLVLRFYYLPAARLRVEGIENVPRKGGCVLVCNHTRGNDYFPLGMALPRMPNFMIKAEAFRWHPFMNWLLRTGGAFPVDRSKGDVEALQTAVDVVQNGGLLAMFPEGHRSEDGKLQAGKTGATRIALEANVPVIPVGVIGAEAGSKNFPRFWKRPVILVRIGKPYVLEGRNGQDRAAVAAGTRRIMMSIADLLPYEMRGVWADPAMRSSGRSRARSAAAGTTPAAHAESVESAGDPAASHFTPLE